MTTSPLQYSPPPDDQDTQRYRHRDLEQIAIASLECARVLMETGSRAKVVHECCQLLATGLEAKMMGCRVGYASISVTLVSGTKARSSEIDSTPDVNRPLEPRQPDAPKLSGSNTITRMVTVHRHRMDYRLNHAIRGLVVAASNTGMQPAEITARLDAIAVSSPRHPLWFVVASVGLACAAFGALLGTDLSAFVPVLLAGGIGQLLRHHMLRGSINPYVATVATAFAAASICGIGARIAGSDTINLAMIAATLLLVPGIPATNAQADILDGSPTLGSARAISVFMTMVFITTGIFAAQAMFGVHQ